MSDRGEHTETATRAGEAYAVRAIVSEFGTEREETRQMVDFVYPIIAAAVRAEEREQAKLRILARAEPDHPWTLTPSEQREAHRWTTTMRIAARIAADESSS